MSHNHQSTPRKPSRPQTSHYPSSSAHQQQHATRDLTNVPKSLGKKSEKLSGLISRFEALDRLGRPAPPPQPLFGMPVRGFKGPAEGSVVVWRSGGGEEHKANKERLTLNLGTTIYRTEALVTKPLALAVPKTDTTDTRQLSTTIFSPRPLSAGRYEKVFVEDESPLIGDDVFTCPPYDMVGSLVKAELRQMRSETEEAERQKRYSPITIQQSVHLVKEVESLVNGDLAQKGRKEGFIGVDGSPKLKARKESVGISADPTSTRRNSVLERSPVTKLDALIKAKLEKLDLSPKLKPEPVVRAMMHRDSINPNPLGPYPASKDDSINPNLKDSKLPQLANGSSMYEPTGSAHRSQQTIRDRIRFYDGGVSPSASGVPTPKPGKRPSITHLVSHRKPASTPLKYPPTSTPNKATITPKSTLLTPTTDPFLTPVFQKSEFKTFSSAHKSDTSPLRERRLTRSSIPRRSLNVSTDGAKNQSPNKQEKQSASKRTVDSRIEDFHVAERSPVILDVRSIARSTIRRRSHNPNLEEGNNIRISVPESIKEPHSSTREMRQADGCTTPSKVVGTTSRYSTPKSQRTAVIPANPQEVTILCPASARRQAATAEDLSVILEKGEASETSCIGSDMLKKFETSLDCPDQTTQPPSPPTPPLPDGHRLHVPRKRKSAAELRAESNAPPAQVVEPLYITRKRISGSASHSKREKRKEKDCPQPMYGKDNDSKRRGIEERIRIFEGNTGSYRVKPNKATWEEASPEKRALELTMERRFKSSVKLAPDPERIVSSTGRRELSCGTIDAIAREFRELEARSKSKVDIGYDGASEETLEVMVVKEAKCEIKAPRPLRLVEMRRMVLLCKEKQLTS